MQCHNAGPTVLSLNASVLKYLSSKQKFFEQLEMLKNQQIRNDAAESKAGEELYQTQEKSNVRLTCVKKEKSRDAARSRRGKENFEFYELAKLLPVPSETSSQLDKASIVRLTMSYLQLQKFMLARKSTEPASKPDYFCRAAQQSSFMENCMGSFILQSLDGFIFVLNKDGRFLFVSDTVSIYLGLAQVDLIGTSIFNYTHPADHPELVDHLKNRSNSHHNITRNFHSSDKNEELEADTSSCSFFIRMKSTLTRRGSNVKSIGYKVVHMTGCLSSKIHRRLKVEDASSDDETPTNLDAMLGLTGIAQVLPPPTLIDIKLDQPMFVVRIDASLRVNYCEDRIEQLTDYTMDQVKGRTLYHFIHSSDLTKIRRCHAAILSKGQVVTPYYRWLLKSGKHLWLQSCVTIVVDKHLSSDDDMFIWISYVLGEDISCATSNSTTTKNLCKTKLVNGILEKLEDTSMIDRKLKKVHSLPTRMYSSESSEKLNNEPTNLCINRANSTKRSSSVSDDLECKKQKPSLKSMIPEPTEAKPLKLTKHDDSLDSSSKLWYNPPNREITDHSDLPPGVKVGHPGGTLMTVQPSPTVVRHHYPFGIDPNLLNSNPLLAKMLTAGCAGYDSLFSQSDALIFAAPSMSFLTPVLAPVPHLVPTTNICPSSVATIIEELRKDPLRKKSPPNKVVLPNNTQVKNSPKENESIASSAGCSQTSRTSSLQNTVLSLPNNTVFLSPIPGYQHHTTNPLLLGSIKFPQQINALNSL
uniref:Transcription factor protein n=1 Tax=Ciona intestinalis TaxID=7719 RepID=Q4H2N9_CIOIN|nr:transcription factor protein [Ciona intestinalis]BAE06738.1 transcription factor protein [Ciona intestinalis]|eukprot:NP_001071842.1 transcription factor protein [Ciona intestinalis]